MALESTRHYKINILCHYISRVIGQLNNMTEENVDRYIELFTEADKRYHMYDEPSPKPNTNPTGE